MKTKADQLEAKLHWYEEQYCLSQAKRFGASSEKTLENQLSFFTEAEKEANTKIEEPTLETLETIEYQRKKRKPKRTQEELLDDLPVEQIDYTLTEDEQFCPKCDTLMTVIGTHMRRELVIIPAQAKVIEYRQHRYVCRHCEEQESKTPIVSASMPNAILSGSIPRRHCLRTSSIKNTLIMCLCIVNRPPKS